MYKTYLRGTDVYETKQRSSVVRLKLRLFIILTTAIAHSEAIPIINLLHNGIVIFIIYVTFITNILCNVKSILREIK